MSITANTSKFAPRSRNRPLFRSKPSSGRGFSVPSEAEARRMVLVTNEAARLSRRRHADDTRIDGQVPVEIFATGATTAIPASRDSPAPSVLTNELRVAVENRQHFLAAL